MGEYKILISDNVAQECVDRFKAEGLDVDYNPGLAPDALLARIAGFDGLVVRSATKVTADVIDRGAKLKIIGRAGTGVDNIDVKHATEKGVVVINSLGGNTISAAEQAFALMISLARKTPQAHASVQAGKWERNKFSGVELYQKVLGIIGLGKIGQEVAKRARAFAMEVISFDPVIPDEIFEKTGVAKVEFRTLLQRSDFISLHVPLLPGTRNMIGEKELEICKKDVRIINGSRGGIIDEAALSKALKSGRIAGAALDVYQDEPPKHNLFIGLDNIVTTPHLGASTSEAQVRVAVEIAETMVAHFRNQKIDNIVNPEVLGR